MTDDERKELERAAYGKRVTFHTRHHWILTWLEERPGKSLAAKVWSIIDQAYRADYAERGRVAMGRYWKALEGRHYPDLDYDALTAALCDACECFGRAGLRNDEESAREMLRAAVHSAYQHSKAAA